jgi:membrane protein implicated in regulation of membrane protease activity
MDVGRRLWWLLVAGILAGLLLFDSVGYQAGGTLIVATVLGVIGYRWYRRRNPPPGGVIRCLKCGETLAASARSCKYCGSASWTYIQ